MIKEPLFTIQNLPDDVALHLAAVRARHPRRKSPCAALLADIHTGEDTAQRARSADLFGWLGCRKKIRSLAPLIGRLEAEVPSDDIWEIGDLLYSLIIALGFSDSPSGHRQIRRLLVTSCKPSVRAAALEAMAFESEQFDMSLILPFVSPNARAPEIISALYALRYCGYAGGEPEDAARRIAPLLEHEYPMVRASAVELLQESRVHEDLVLMLEHDPSDAVRQCVHEARRYWEQQEEESEGGTTNG